VTDPETSLIRVATWGGDSDTVGAIVGALCGAAHGTRWIPHRWYDKIEDQIFGKTFIIKTAKQLATVNAKEKLSVKETPQQEEKPKETEKEETK
jgi:hypothetical protein